MMPEYVGEMTKEKIYNSFKPFIDYYCNLNRSLINL